MVPGLDKGNLWGLIGGVLGTQSRGPEKDEKQAAAFADYSSGSMTISKERARLGHCCLASARMSATVSVSSMRSIPGRVSITSSMATMPATTAANKLVAYVYNTGQWANNRAFSLSSLGMVG